MAHLRQLYDVDLKLLRTFCTIVEEGSFAAAQITLNLSQSALSEYLKSLETRLGTRLCQRGPKGFKLYREGELVYQAARELFSSIEAFKQRAADLNGGQGCELTIAVQDGIIENPDARVTEAVTRFSDYYPGACLRIEISFGLKLAGRIADGSVDVGICLLHDRLKTLAVEPLMEEPADLYCSDRHPLFEVPEPELTRECIDAAAYCHRGQFEYFHPSDGEPFARRGDVGHGAHAQLALVLSGRNIGYLPTHIARDFCASGRLRALRPDLMRIVNPIVAVTGRLTPDFKLARSFVDCLVDCHMETQLKHRTGSRQLRSMPVRHSS